MYASFEKTISESEYRHTKWNFKSRQNPHESTGIGVQTIQNGNRCRSGSTCIPHVSDWPPSWITSDEDISSSLEDFAHLRGNLKNLLKNCLNTKIHWIYSFHKQLERPLIRFFTCVYESYEPLKLYYTTETTSERKSLHPARFLKRIWKHGPLRTLKSHTMEMFA